MQYHSFKMLFPGGKVKALTMSYDDGVTQDERLIEIFDTYGIKGTFNLNSGLFGQKSYRIVNGSKVNHSHIPKSGIREVYKNHEVAIHTLTHSHIDQLPRQILINEVLKDKENLEEIVGYPVRGMAYPYGAYNSDVLDTLRLLNIEYSRTVKRHYEFSLPADFLEWGTTCHYNDKELSGLAEEFIKFENKDNVLLFYVWGHSYEFDVYNNWDTIKDFCKIIGNNPDIWYATNIEIVDYINAYKSLKFSLAGSSVYNPTGTDIWFSLNGKTFEIKKGSIRVIFSNSDS